MPPTASGPTPDQTEPLESTSLRVSLAQRNQEAINNSHRPLVEVARRTQLPPVAAGHLQPILQEVIHAEVGFARIGRRQAQRLRRVRTDVAAEKLLLADDQLGAAHLPLNDMQL